MPLIDPKSEEAEHKNPRYALRFMYMEQEEQRCYFEGRGDVQRATQSDQSTWKRHGYCMGIMAGAHAFKIVLVECKWCTWLW